MQDGGRHVKRERWHGFACMPLESGWRCSPSDCSLACLLFHVSLLSLSTCCLIWKSFKVYLPCRTLLGLDIRMEPQKTCTRDERHWQSQIFVCRPHPQWKEVDEGRGQWGRARLLGDRKKDELSVYSDIFESLFIIIIMFLFVCLFFCLHVLALHEGVATQLEHKNPQT